MWFSVAVTPSTRVQYLLLCLRVSVLSLGAGVGTPDHPSPTPSSLLRRRGMSLSSLPQSPNTTVELQMNQP